MAEESKEYTIDIGFNINGPLMLRENTSKWTVYSKAEAVAVEIAMTQMLTTLAKVEVATVASVDPEGALMLAGM